MLGGRESEAIAMGDITTGAEKDLVQATRLVRHMITRWGWGVWALWRFRRTRNSRFSAMNWLRGRNYSDATAARIDREVEHIIAARQETVHQVLTRARVQLDTLADAL